MNVAAVGKVGTEFRRFSNLAAINVWALKITVEYSFLLIKTENPP